MQIRIEQKNSRCCFVKDYLFEGTKETCGLSVGRVKGSSHFINGSKINQCDAVLQIKNFVSRILVPMCETGHQGGFQTSKSLTVRYVVPRREAFIRISHFRVKKYFINEYDTDLSNRRLLLGRGLII